jgi:hypothetical protein
LRAVNRIARSVKCRPAHRLDPLSLAINTDIGFRHSYNGRHAEAV